MIYVLLCILSYFIGGIPFGYIIAKMKGIDIMKLGSGNIGATNATRVLGTAPGILVFFLDCLKGFLPTVLAYQLTQSHEFSLIAGLCTVVGHSLSPFLGFRGGKGVSTAFGVLLGSVPIGALVVFITFFVVLALTRYVSIASMCSGVALFVSALVFRQPLFFVIVFALMSILVIVRHRGNIKRLLAHTEPKIRPIGSIFMNK